MGEESKPHILVVDDDDRLRSLLRKFLKEQGFMVVTASDVEDACLKLEQFTFDLMILDVMMPGRSGLDMLKELKMKRLPVLMLSAMGESDDRIKGLEYGADDYVAKPFEPKELVLRIRALLRRAVAQREQAATVSFGSYCFNVASNQLTREGSIVALTSNEAMLLAYLAGHAGEPISREELMKHMAGVSNERAVDVQITRLRKKIEDTAGKPVYLQTVRGAGYVLYAERE